MGVQLDVIGRIVGQARLGADDPTYRLYLKGRIAALRSNGVPEAVYRVFRGLEGGAALVVYWWGGVCQAVYTWSDVITHPCSDVALTLIRMATLGGVKVWLEWQESATAACITFDDDSDHSDGLGFCSDDELDGGVLADAAALE